MGALAEGERRPRTPDEIYHQGLGLGREEDSGSGLAVLIGMAIVVSLSLMALPLLESVVQDPRIRWGFFMVVLAVCGAAAVWAVYPRRDYRPWVPPEAGDVRVPGEAERELGMVASAMQGSPFSQLQAYLELREMLVRRYMLRHHLSRAEAEARLGDAGSSGRPLADEELDWLLRQDLKRAYSPESLATAEGQALLGEFPSRFPRLLSRLEELV